MSGRGDQTETWTCPRCGSEVSNIRWTRHVDRCNGGEDA